MELILLNKNYWYFNGDDTYLLNRKTLVDNIKNTYFKCPKCKHEIPNDFWSGSHHVGNAGNNIFIWKNWHLCGACLILVDYNKTSYIKIGIKEFRAEK